MSLANSNHNDDTMSQKGKVQHMFSLQLTNPPNTQPPKPRPLDPDYTFGQALIIVGRGVSWTGGQRGLPNNRTTNAYVGNYKLHALMMRLHWHMSPLASIRRN